MNTHVKFIAFFLSPLMGIVHCDRDPSPFSDHSNTMDPHYPTILTSLTSVELRLLQQEFDELNDDKICIKLNRFGFTGEQDIFKSHPNPRTVLTEREALNIAVNSIIKNFKFTNVSDSLDLLSAVQNTHSLETDHTAWEVCFGPQKYKGYEIQSSRIIVRLYGDGVFQIYGFWYKDIYLPPREKFDINDAKENIIGKSITWYSDVDQPNEIIIDREIITGPIVKAIFPLEKEDSIELRVVWKIPINFSDIIGWYLYFDAETGEIVKITQEFVT